jgi:hypothetical protein
VKQQVIPNLVDVEEAFTGFVTLPIKEIQRRAQGSFSA